MKKAHLSFVSLFVITVIAFAAKVCWANGKGGHDHGHGMSDHMKAMYALKDKVPEDYQIMERTPIIPDEESLKAGATLFRQQCTVCHGEHGRGDGPAAKGLKPQPANFLDHEHSAIYGPGEKFWIIGNGSGETGMPAFSSLSLVERWNLVNFIYKLQGNTATKGEYDHSH